MLGGLAYVKSLYVTLTKNGFQMSEFNKGLKSNAQYFIDSNSCVSLGTNHFTVTNESYFADFSTEQVSAN